MRFAVVSDDIGYKNDNIFDPVLNNYFWQPFKQAFDANGHEIHTLDMYSGSNQADYYLFFAPVWNVAYNLTRQGLGTRLVYLCAEPPTVVKYNSLEGFSVLKKIFPYIFTYNREWVDEKNIFYRCIPYKFYYHENAIPFDERKLITGITANKRSNHPNELYTEREMVYSFFEEKYPSEFDFYGVGWDKSGHPNYRGTVDDKADTYRNYKFAIAFENIKGVHDYVSEKVFDCICSGVVPIYAGAPNVGEYVPEGSYIDYFSFNSIEELSDYITGMDQKIYEQYIENGKKLLKTKIPEELSITKYVEHILAGVRHEAPYNTDFRTQLWLKAKAMEQQYYFYKARKKK